MFVAVARLPRQLCRCSCPSNFRAFTTGSRVVYARNTGKHSQGGQPSSDGQPSEPVQPSNPARPPAANQSDTPPHLAQAAAQRPTSTSELLQRMSEQKSWSNNVPLRSKLQQSQSLRQQKNPWQKDWDDAPPTSQDGYGAAQGPSAAAASAASATSSPVPSTAQAVRNMEKQPQWTTPVYRLHCKATNNNVILNFTKSNGDTILWVSGGKIGFTNVRRSTYEAGYQCAVKVIKAIEQVANDAFEESKGEATIENAIKLELFFKGFGQGREALINTLNGVEGQKVKPYVSRLTDRTPIKIGGTRAPKMKRL